MRARGEVKAGKRQGHKNEKPASCGPPSSFLRTVSTGLGTSGSVRKHTQGVPCGNAHKDSRALLSGRHKFSFVKLLLGLGGQFLLRVQGFTIMITPALVVHVA